MQRIVADSCLFFCNCKLSLTVIITSCSMRNSREAALDVILPDLLVSACFW